MNSTFGSESLSGVSATGHFGTLLVKPVNLVIDQCEIAFHIEPLRLKFIFLDSFLALTNIGLASRHSLNFPPDPPQALDLGRLTKHISVTSLSLMNDLSDVHGLVLSSPHHPQSSSEQGNVGNTSTTLLKLCCIKTKVRK